MGVQLLAEVFEGAGPQLARRLGRAPEPPADLVERAALVIAPVDHLPVGLRQAVDGAAEGVVALAGHGLAAGRLRGGEGRPGRAAGAWGVVEGDLAGDVALGRVAVALDGAGEVV